MSQNKALPRAVATAWLAHRNNCRPDNAGPGDPGLNPARRRRTTMVHGKVSTLVHGTAGEDPPDCLMPHKGCRTPSRAGKTQNGCNAGGVNRVA